MEGINYATEYKLTLKVEPIKQWYDYATIFTQYFFDKLTPLKRETQLIQATQSAGVFSFFLYMRRM
jgi:hypothetical protein